uniref:Stromal cell-derived factor 1 n=1 Tax=Anas platyrhynchos platyrhynchos TaxID=8840 RepID=U3J6R4_ANAPP
MQGSQRCSPRVSPQEVCCRSLSTSPLRRGSCPSRRCDDSWKRIVHSFSSHTRVSEKPVSLTYRCPCRFYESNVARANIKHLKILSTPNCSLQIVARLKSNSKQVCIDPKLKWIQEYLEKALNKPRHRTHKKKQQKKRGPLCPSRATPLKSPGRKNGGSRCKRQAL